MKRRREKTKPNNIVGFLFLFAILLYSRIEIGKEFMSNYESR